MYDRILEDFAAKLADVEGVKSVCLGLEETGDTPAVRLWIASASAPEGADARRTATRLEMVTLHVQVDAFPDRDRRASYLESLAIVGRVKARLEVWRRAGREGIAGPIAYQLMRLPDADAAMHLLTCTLAASVSPEGDTQLLKADMR